MEKKNNRGRKRVTDKSTLEMTHPMTHYVFPQNFFRVCKKYSKEYPRRMCTKWSAGSALFQLSHLRTVAMNTRQRTDVAHWKGRKQLLSCLLQRQQSTINPLVLSLKNIGGYNIPAQYKMIECGFYQIFPILIAQIIALIETWEKIVKYHKITTLYSQSTSFT